MHKKITAEIQNALKELDIPTCDFVVEHPAELSHGDYASNVAMVAAQQAGKNPKELAKEIVRYIVSKKPKHIETVEVAGPGFINFFLSRDFFGEKIAAILSSPDEWGKNDSWGGKTVLVEYTDPNPFKEFHVGHLFTNSVGESLARLFMFAGADTKRVNYQGDVGLHVACAIWGLEELGFAGARDFTVQELGKAYSLGAKAYKENEEAAEKIKYINKAVYERSDENINALYDKGKDVSLTYFDGIYELLGTQFDHLFFESEAGERGKQLVLEHPDIFPESDGARVFKGEEHGLHTRVFINSEGLPTYEAKELALAKMKDEVFPYGHSVISTSNEITEYFKVLKCAMGKVYPELAEKTEHIGHGNVRFADRKMSSRTGDVIPALDFVLEIKEATEARMKESGTKHNEALTLDIALGAIKYATLKSSIRQDSIFDTAQALSFEGDSGPYLQYTHARINSLLEKATKIGISPSTEKAPEKPYEVEKWLYRFPEVVETALLERSPHYVANYLIELAGAFNTFYGTEKIVDTEDERAPYKLAVAEAVKITLKNGLFVLGIKAPGQM